MNSFARRYLIAPMAADGYEPIRGTVDAVATELMTWRWVPEIRTIHHYHDDPAYIRALAASICHFGLIPGVVIGGRFRANGDGPTRLVVEAVGFEPTRRYEGYGRPNACRGVSSVQ